MQKIENFKEIDLEKCIYTIWHKKAICIKTCIISLICGAIIAFSIPASFTVSVLLSPESGSSTNNNFSNMASILGINSLNGSNTDAINSSMFTEIITSTPFILDLYQTEITQSDSTKILFHQYIESQKAPWWNAILQSPYTIINIIKKTISHDKIINQNIINPFKLTQHQNKIIEQIKKSISAKTDKKSNITTISVTLQNPEVAAIVANITLNKLQLYFTDYKVKKAKEDYLYLENLCKERKEEYYNKQEIYASFLDKNRNINLQQIKAESARLENEMEISYNIYNQIQTQLELARAKVQEAKPIFAVIEPASVPIYPSSPNKTLITIGFMILGFILSISWILFGKVFFTKIKNKLFK